MRSDSGQGTKKELDALRRKLHRGLLFLATYAPSLWTRYSMPLPVAFDLPRIGGEHLRITFEAGKVFIIAGPNGSGKSSLIYQIYKAVPEGAASYYPGHRQITFNNGVEQLGQDMLQLQRNLYASFDAFNRYKGTWGEDHLKSVIRRLVNAEAGHNQQIVERIKVHDDSAIMEARSRSGPFSVINSIFEAADLPIRLSTNKLGINVTRGASSYTVDQLSDG